jgi:hypothetical protein
MLSINLHFLQLQLTNQRLFLMCKALLNLPRFGFNLVNIDVVVVDAVADVVDVVKIISENRVSVARLPSEGS